MGISKQDFQAMVGRVVAGREKRLHEPLKIITQRKTPVVRTDNLSYNPKLLTPFLAEFQVPAPEYEYHFVEGRRFRFDLAWPEHLVALEVQGGIWTGGGHVRGAAVRNEFDKLNLACGLGWRVLFCFPETVMTADTARSLKVAIFFKRR